ncbi:hypothetical protein COB21_00690 [Candidatus Aerophobetes bacterium]|uniref:Uncharacterized protein n=1 Tax=Aerophobetes bacterium TaxID=2030807 RepID=A0A2A4X7A4_UNCAE|nr:MAG: hypothetical protein COB21_00690 [Candidatus Aerophobetes bacterium]
MSFPSMPPVPSYREAKYFAVKTSRVVFSQAKINLYGSGKFFQAVVAPLVPGAKPVFAAFVGAGQVVNTWEKCNELVGKLFREGERAYHYPQGAMDIVVVWLKNADNQELVLKTTKEFAKLALLLYCPASGTFKVIKVAVSLAVDVYGQINDETSLVKLVLSGRLVEFWDNEDDVRGEGSAATYVKMAKFSGLIGSSVFAYALVAKHVKILAVVTPARMGSIGGSFMKMKGVTMYLTGAYADFNAPAPRPGQRRRRLVAAPVQREGVVGGGIGGGGGGSVAGPVMQPRLRRALSNHRGDSGGGIVDMDNLGPNGGSFRTGGGLFVAGGGRSDDGGSRPVVVQQEWQQQQWSDDDGTTGEDSSSSEASGGVVSGNGRGDES